jgi:hypothetical protein
MVTRDPHRFVNELDKAALERLIARLESRAQDAVFARLFDKYATKLALPPSAQVLEVGCGTGALLRSLARRDDFTGEAFSAALSLMLRGNSRGSKMSATDSSFKSVMPTAWIFPLRHSMRLSHTR